MNDELHLAVIPDGNRRWGSLNHKTIIESHVKGVEKLKDLVHWCEELGVKTLSIWIFSTENASRSKEEIGALFTLFGVMLDRIGRDKDYDTLRKRAKIRFVGSLDIFPEIIRNKVKKIEDETAKNKEFNLMILCGYGGRQELIDAANHMISDAILGDLKKVDEKTFSSYLYAPDVSDPDLVFRSAGEKRLSGLLPWQTVYSEFYFCEKLWPDVEKSDIQDAIDEYKGRKRKFGK